MIRKLRLYFFVVNDEDTVLAQKNIEITNSLTARQKRKLSLDKLVRKALVEENKIRLKRLSTIKN